MHTSSSHLIGDHTGRRTFLANVIIPSEVDDGNRGWRLHGFDLGDLCNFIPAIGRAWFDINEIQGVVVLAELREATTREGPHLRNYFLLSLQTAGNARYTFRERCYGRIDVTFRW